MKDQLKEAILAMMKDKRAQDAGQISLFET